jgi:hypothetical protein
MGARSPGPNPTLSAKHTFSYTAQLASIYIDARCGQNLTAGPGPESVFTRAPRIDKTGSAENVPLTAPSRSHRQAEHSQRRVPKDPGCQHHHRGVIVTGKPKPGDRGHAQQERDAIGVAGLRLRNDPGATVGKNPAPAPVQAAQVARGGVGVRASPAGRGERRSRMKTRSRSASFSM